MIRQRFIDASPEDQQRALGHLLGLLPTKERMSTLAFSVIANNAGATLACRALISLAKLMASNLTAQQRSAVAWHMRAEADELDGPIH